MAYRDFPFPPSTPLYPAASVVLKYLRDYSTAFDLEQHIQYHATVTHVYPMIEGPGGTFKWTVMTGHDADTAGAKNKTWTNVDTVLVTNGRCSHPFLPHIPGLDRWLSTTQPGSSLPKAHHSNIYRSPEPYAHKRVVVVGNGPSALDAAPEIASVASRVYRSTRAVNPNASDRDDRPANEFSYPSMNDMIEVVGEVGSFGDAEAGEMTLKEGRQLSTVDHVVLATGYRISCPFFVEPVMKDGYPPLQTAKEGNDAWLYNSGHHIYPLARHLFPVSPHLPLGSLFFFGLPRPIVPLPLMEAQCLLVASILSGMITLDMNEERKAVYERTVQLLGMFGGDWRQAAVEWHKLGQDLQFDYRVSLIALAGLEDQAEQQVPSWQRRIYAKKRELRAAWKALERRGEDERTVEGVGEGGEREWVELMDRLIQQSTSPSIDVERIQDNL